MGRLDEIPLDTCRGTYSNDSRDRDIDLRWVGGGDGYSPSLGSAYRMIGGRQMGDERRMTGWDKFIVGWLLFWVVFLVCMLITGD